MICRRAEIPGRGKKKGAIKLKQKLVLRICASTDDLKYTCRPFNLFISVLKCYYVRVCVCARVCASFCVVLHLAVDRIRHLADGWRLCYTHKGRCTLSQQYQYQWLINEAVVDHVNRYDNKLVIWRLLTESYFVVALAY